MAQLTGNQINNSYQGLIKTESNGAIGAGATNLTDGLGNQTGLTLNSGGEVLYTAGTGYTDNSIKNTTWNLSNYPMGAIGGSATSFNMKDSVDNYIGYISMDRYGSMYYMNAHGNQGESHVFQSKTGAGGTTPAKISMNAYNSVNNSDNWYLGYQQSVDALSYNSTTGDLTLGRQLSSDLVVNIPVPVAGVTSIIAGSGISVDQSTGDVTVTATGGGGGGVTSTVGARPDVNLGGALSNSYYRTFPTIGDMSGSMGAAIDQGNGAAFISRFLPSAGYEITEWILPIFNNAAFTGNHTMEVAVYDMYPGSFAPRNKVHSDTVVIPLTGSNINYVYSLPTSFTPTSDAYWIAIQSDTSDTDGVYIGVAYGFSNQIINGRVSYNSDPAANARGMNILRYASGALPATFTETQEFGQREEFMFLGYR
mgnify:CR=1 FL=1